MADEVPARTAPAYYAARRGGITDWWTLLHPPYTGWHLAYVVIGATLAPQVHLGRLLATLLAFFAAVGLSAHALDELQGRPLQTAIPSPVLVAVAVAGLAAALAIGGAGVLVVGWPLIVFIVVGPLLVLAYNLELFGGLVHTDVGFALSWGGFPVLTAYVAQTGRLAAAPVVAALGAVALSAAQRALSTPARLLRRRALGVGGHVDLVDGTSRRLDAAALLAPLERALRATSWGVMSLATALALVRLS